MKINSSISSYVEPRSKISHGFFDDDYKVLAMSPKEALKYFDSEMLKNSDPGPMGMKMTHYYTRLSMDTSLPEHEKNKLQNELEEKYVKLAIRMNDGYLNERDESIVRNLIQGMSGSDGYESPYENYITAVLAGNFEGMVNAV